MLARGGRYVHVFSRRRNTYLQIPALHWSRRVGGSTDVTMCNKVQVFRCMYFPRNTCIPALSCCIFAKIPGHTAPAYAPASALVSAPVSAVSSPSARSHRRRIESLQEVEPQQLALGEVSMRTPVEVMVERSSTMIQLNSTNLFMM